MKFLLHCVAVVVLANITLAQRPFYAGSKPIGYPELHSRFQNNETEEATTALANRLGESGNAGPPTTTERLPYDALGQKELIDRIKTWPRDQWPFWYLNYLAIESHRNARPGTNIQTAGQANVQPNPNQNQQGMTGQIPQQQPATNNQNWQTMPTGGQNTQPMSGGQNWQNTPTGGQNMQPMSGGQNWQNTPTGGQNVQPIPAGGQNWQNTPVGQNTQPMSGQNWQNMPTNGQNADPNWQYMPRNPNGQPSNLDWQYQPGNTQTRSGNWRQNQNPQREQRNWRNYN